MKFVTVLKYIEKSYKDKPSFLILMSDGKEYISNGCQFVENTEENIEYLVDLYGCRYFIEELLNTEDCNILDIVDASHMLQGCKHITEFKVDLPNTLYTSCMLEGCTSLTEFKCKLPKTIDASSMLFGCMSLIKFECDLPSAIYTSCMLYGCTSLTEFKCDLPKARYTTGMLSFCKALKCNKVKTQQQQQPSLSRILNTLALGAATLISSTYLLTTVEEAPVSLENRLKIDVINTDKLYVNETENTDTIQPVDLDYLSDFRSLTLPDVDIQLTDTIDFKCFANIVYKEARGEPIAAQQAVAQVVYNRLQKYPELVDFCGVMWHKTGNTWQFSWMSDNKTGKIAANTQDIDEMSGYIASIYAGGYTVPKLENALYFKQCNVHSQWWTTLKMVKREGSHCFYREKRKGK